MDFPMGSESFMSFDSEREQLFNYHLSLLQVSASLWQMLAACRVEWGVIC